MLNIPEEIKELLKKDGTRKNFRVHFPNGEREDITNENVVSESVRFTESLNSQGGFKLGLCETPYIEFETFGVGNIKGATIECSIEIQKDDGSYYSISYGTFVVNSCKKQADMSHRLIMAYGINNFHLTKESQDVLQKFIWRYNNLKISTEALVKMCVPSWNEHMVDATLYRSYHREFTKEYTVGSDVYKLEFYTEKYSIMDLETRVSNVVHLKVNYTQGFINSIKTIFNLLPDEIKEIVSKDSFPNLNGFNSLSGTNIEYWRGNAKETDFEYWYTLKSKDNRYINLCNPFKLSPEMELCFPMITLKEYSTKTSTLHTWWETNAFGSSSTFYFDAYARVVLYKNGHPIEDTIAQYTDVKVDDFVPIFESDFGSYTEVGSSKKKYIMDKNTDTSETDVSQNLYLLDFSNVIAKDYREEVSAFIELSGKLGKNNRDGSFEAITIKGNNGLFPSLILYPSNDLYPAGTNGGNIKKCNYRTLWYDDDYVMPIGKVICSYNDGTEDNSYAEVYCSGYNKDSDVSSYSVYDISDNLIIKNNVIAEETIMNVLNEIAANISGITYMPSQIVMQGRPDLEAGDMLEVYSDDEVITTIVLQRTLSGIQALTDEIRSSWEGV